MAHENIQKVEKLLDLGNNVVIYRVHLDALREQDKNARVMALEKFERLTANIQKDARLESLPLCTPKQNQAGNNEFLIISGHHRVRAARSAGLQFIPIMVLEEELTPDQIKSKQLAHNALAGYDNMDVLTEIYKEIEDVNEKMASGLTELDFQIDAPNVPVDDIEVNFDFELLNVLFMPKQAKRFDEILALIEPSAKLYLADKKDFERLAAQIQEISKRDNIRNISAIMARMIDIVEQYHKEFPPIENKLIKKDDKAKPKTKTAGRVQKKN